MNRRPLCKQNRLDLRGHSGFTLTELVVAIVIATILIGALIKGLEIARTISRNVGCSNHLRNLHLLLNRYAFDNGDCYPPGYGKVDGGSSRTWSFRLQAYHDDGGIKKTGISYCPATRLDGSGIYKRDVNTWRTDYDINTNAASSDQAKNRRSVVPQRLILLYDGAGGAPGGAHPPPTHWSYRRHSGRFNAIFVDGHIESLENFDTNANYWR